jgi:Rieske Fe-S protein
MALSAGSDSRSIRDAADPEGQPLLLVGGAGHTVGRKRDESAGLDRLRRWTQQHFDKAEEVAAWGAQDHSTTSGVPLVGRMPLSRGVVRLATGFDKWGLTNGPAAGLAMARDILGDQALGHPVSYLGARPAPASWAINNALTGAHMVRDLAAAVLPGTGGDVTVKDLARGCGVCPHMGGLLRWNSAEETWDCPLHGSRFATDGSVLEGPAQRPAKVPPPPESGT